MYAEFCVGENVAPNANGWFVGMLWHCVPKDVHVGLKIFRLHYAIVYVSSAMETAA